MADEDVKIVIKQKGTIPVYTTTRIAGVEIFHDESLEGKGTPSIPLKISEEIIEKIENAGKIDDVRVDGVSVVTNKIAEIDLTGKVDKTSEADKIYGTDSQGNQTIYDKDSFGQVDDVQLNGVSVVVDKVANIEPDAQDIAYTNDQYPTMHNLQDAMDKLLYVEPTVSISGGGNYEIGSTRATTTLTWTWNKTIQSQSLNQGIGDLDPTLRTYTYESPISTNTTFTITGTDGTTQKSASTNLRFLPKRYWGVSAKTSLTDAEIIELSSELSTSRIQTRTFDCSGGKYFYFAIKTSYCNGIAFKVGGLSFSDMLVETRQFTNASGYTDSYNIYRVNNIQTGSAIQVEVL